MRIKMKTKKTIIRVIAIVTVLLIMAGMMAMSIK